MEQLELWSKCSKNLESSLSQDEYNTWIRPLKASKKKNTLELVAPNDFILDYIEKNFANSIQDLVKKYSKQKINLIFKTHTKESFVDKYKTTKVLRLGLLTATLLIPLLKESQTIWL